MPKSEVINQILTSYIETHPEQSEDTTILLQAFCDYAADWLATNGVIGLGHTANGLSLRFFDGTEKVLFSAPVAPRGAATNSVDISGNGGSGITRIAADTNPSVAITGR